MDIKDTDLDETFIGQWEIIRVDDYLSLKAGTVPVIAVVRSKKDLELGIITFYSTIHPKYKNDPIIMDGSMGIMGRITEKFEINPPTLSRVEVIYIHCITGSDILSRIERTKDGDMFVRGTCEFDDIIFDSENIPMDITYYIKGDKTKYLWGVKLVIPIDRYNYYVKMRDLWYRDYKGCQPILYPCVHL